MVVFRAVIDDDTASVKETRMMLIKATLQAAVGHAQVCVNFKFLLRSL